MVCMKILIVIYQRPLYRYKVLQKSNRTGEPAFNYPSLSLRWYSNYLLIFSGLTLNLNKVKNLQNYSKFMDELAVYAFQNTKLKS